VKQTTIITQRSKLKMINEQKLQDKENRVTAEYKGKLQIKKKEKS
jgi:hypothetical protein